MFSRAVRRPALVAPGHHLGPAGVGQQAAAGRTARPGRAGRGRGRRSSSTVGGSAAGSPGLDHGQARRPRPPGRRPRRRVASSVPRHRACGPRAPSSSTRAPPRRCRPTPVADRRPAAAPRCPAAGRPGRPPRPAPRPAPLGLRLVIVALPGSGRGHREDGRLVGHGGHGRGPARRRPSDGVARRRGQGGGQHPGVTRACRRRGRPGVERAKRTPRADLVAGPCTARTRCRRVCVTAGPRAGGGGLDGHHPDVVLGRRTPSSASASRR